MLETLIALVIAGLALMSTFSAISLGIRNGVVAERYQEGLSRARSRLEAFCADPAPGEYSGDDGAGFRWRASVNAVGSTGARDVSGRPIPSADRPVVTLFATTVWVSWKEAGGSRMIRLHTQRLWTPAEG